jgi:cytochrome P450
LLTVTDDSGEKFSAQQVRDESITMLVAGHETTALALSYSCYLLAQHPEIQERLAEELQAVLNGRIPTLEDLSSLTYTDAVIQESMRLYPPAWLIGREALEDCTIGGYQINKGEQVILPQWVVHRDPRWYEDPLAFQPERWLDGLEKSIPKFAYFPFGGGPRICIGNHFSLMEMKLALAILFQRFTVSSCEEHALEVFPFITLRPQNGVYVRIKRRGSLP